LLKALIDAVEELPLEALGLTRASMDICSTSRGLRPRAETTSMIRIAIGCMMTRYGRIRRSQMSKESLEGQVRSGIGQAEKIVGQAIGDKATAARGAYDDAGGKAQAALGSAKDTVNESVNAVSALDLSGVRNEITKLAQTVSDLAQKQVSSGRDQVVGAVEAADVETRIKKNPWAAVAIAALIGLLIGKMS
jgi:uncharacterized protein YjbJ (UPF0337 family)